MSNKRDGTRQRFLKRSVTAAAVGWLALILWAGGVGSAAAGDSGSPTKETDKTSPIVGGQAGGIHGTQECPPPPEWLLDVTRVAYTDLPNTTRQQDWPEKVIADLAAAGVQMFFSRAHSGESWRGLGWKSQHGEIDPAMRGKLIDWEVVGGAATDEDAHSGRRCLKLVHDGARSYTYLNRAWKIRGGEQGAMLDQHKGELSFWYKVLSATNANLWIGAIPMSSDPAENTGSPRAGIVIPAEHVGDGQWHHVTIPYDFTANSKVKWVHVSCFLRGTAAEVLLDDLEYLDANPQPVTNGGFEEVTPDRDGTREVVELCHKHGIRYLAYYWAQREPKSVGEAHPEWRCRNKAGQPTAYYCVNTPHRDLVRNRIVELVKEVGVDGIFFDMFHARKDECYCEACKSKFRALTGQEPPLEEDFDSVLWQQWVNFKYRSIEAAMLDFNRAIKAANPEAALVVNTWNAWVYGHSHNTRNSIRVVENVDGLLEETGWYDTVDPSFFAFPARHNFMNWHLAGLCKGKRAFMWSSPSVSGWLPLPAHEARTRVATMMTNGAVPAQSVPGRDVLQTYMADIAEREEYLRGARLAPWCGLVVSEKTELWDGKGDAKNRYVKGVYGAYQAMLERHLPVSLVTDRELKRGVLEDHKVLFLPNCAAMSDAELDTVRRFVREGGGLVATYETSLYDENAQPRKSFGLADLLHATKVGAFDNLNMRSGWNPRAVHHAHLFFGEGHRWSNDSVVRQTLSLRSVTQPEGTLNRHVPLHCRMLQVKPTAGAPSPLRLTTAHYDKKTSQLLRTNHCAVIESTYGKGRVVYVPFDVSWSFFRYGHEYLGRLMELALRDVATEPPPVEVEAPTVVQAMTHLQKDRVIVHLLNDVSSTGRSQNVVAESLYVRRETLPIHDIRVTFHDPALTRFFLVPGKTPLTVTKTDEGSTVTVPKLDLHCMVVAEP